MVAPAALVGKPASHARRRLSANRKLDRGSDHRPHHGNPDLNMFDCMKEEPTKFDVKLTRALAPHCHDAPLILGTDRRRNPRSYP